MKYLTRAVFSALVIGVVACGGVSDDAKLAELSDDEVTDLCSEVVAETKDCGSGVTASRNGPSECAAGMKNVPTSCAATVGDFRECNDADVCEFLSNAACGRIFQCSSSSGGS
jgi:hypothetical protein